MSEYINSQPESSDNVEQSPERLALLLDRVAERMTAETLKPDALYEATYNLQCGGLYLARGEKTAVEAIQEANKNGLFVSLQEANARATAHNERVHAQTAKTIAKLVELGEILADECKTVTAYQGQFSKPDGTQVAATVVYGSDQHEGKKITDITLSDADLQRSLQIVTDGQDIQRRRLHIDSEDLLRKNDSLQAIPAARTTLKSIALDHHYEEVSLTGDEVLEFFDRVVEVVDIDAASRLSDRDFGDLMDR